MKRTHKGLFAGIVPVYLDTTVPNCPSIETRHVIFEPLMDITEFFLGLVFSFYALVDPDFEPMFPIKITGEVHE